jgi:hypothetical protein
MPGPNASSPRDLIAVFWHAGLGIAGALDLAESDLDERRVAALVRHRKSGFTGVAGEGFEPSKAEPTDLQLHQISLAQVFSRLLRSLKYGELRSNTPSWEHVGNTACPASAVRRAVATRSSGG